MISFVSFALLYLVIKLINMKKERYYVLAIVRHDLEGPKPAKQVVLPYSARSLERLLLMASKLDYSLRPFTSHIFKVEDSNFVDLVYIANRKYIC